MLATFKNDADGPALEIGISVTQSTLAAIIPPPNTVWVKAIADTGATATSIGTSVAQRAGLPIVGKAQVRSASHIILANQFFVDIWIRCMLSGTQIEWPFRNKVLLELTLQGATNEALLGMDIFRDGILLVNGPGGFSTFAW